MNTAPPKVTVLMPVYNAEEFLAEAIESILKQSYRAFEFLIINDGSTDKSESIIKQYASKDKRIRLISRENKKLIATLNEGIEKASGAYIARMDADDISTRDRLKIEVEYLDKHPEVALVGSNYTIIDESGKSLVTTNVFTHPDDLKLCLITCNQYGHGSTMFRKSAVEKLGKYDAQALHIEDYDLWIRISQKYQVANIEESLYKWRKTEGSVTGSNLEFQIQQTYKVRDQAFGYFLKNRRKYRMLSFHKSGTDYARRKSTLYRDFAYLYMKKGQTLKALFMLFLAALYKPKVKRTYYYMYSLFFKKDFLDKWEYEFQ